MQLSCVGSPPPSGTASSTWESAWGQAPVSPEFSAVIVGCCWVLPAPPRTADRHRQPPLPRTVGHSPDICPTADFPIPWCQQRWGFGVPRHRAVTDRKYVTWGESVELLPTGFPPASLSLSPRPQPLLGGVGFWVLSTPPQLRGPPPHHRAPAATLSIVPSTC